MFQNRPPVEFRINILNNPAAAEETNEEYGEVEHLNESFWEFNLPNEDPVISNPTQLEEEFFEMESR